MVKPWMDQRRQIDSLAHSDVDHRSLVTAEQVQNVAEQVLEALDTSQRQHNPFRVSHLSY